MKYSNPVDKVCLYSVNRFSSFWMFSQSEKGSKHPQKFLESSMLLISMVQTVLQLPSISIHTCLTTGACTGLFLDQGCDFNTCRFLFVRKRMICHNPCWIVWFWPCLLSSYISIFFRLLSEQQALLCLQRTLMVKLRISIPILPTSGAATSLTNLANWSLSW